MFSLFSILKDAKMTGIVLFLFFYLETQHLKRLLFLVYWRERELFPSTVLRCSALFKCLFVILSRNPVTLVRVLSAQVSSQRKETKPGKSSAALTSSADLGPVSSRRSRPLLSPPAFAPPASLLSASPSADWISGTQNLGWGCARGERWWAVASFRRFFFFFK